MPAHRKQPPISSTAIRNMRGISFSFHVTYPNTTVIDKENTQEEEGERIRRWAPRLRKKKNEVRDVECGLEVKVKEVTSGRLARVLRWDEKKSSSSEGSSSKSDDDPAPRNNNPPPRRTRPPSRPKPRRQNHNHPYQPPAERSFIPLPIETLPTPVPIQNSKILLKIQHRRSHLQALERRITHSTSTPGQCRMCSTIKTGQWRRGPDGPRTLCNACGLDWSKRVKNEARRRGISVQEAEDRLRRVWMAGGNISQSESASEDESDVNQSRMEVEEDGEDSSSM